MPEQKYIREIQTRHVKYLSAKVSDPSEVPRFAGKLISDLRALDNIVLVCTSDSLVQNIIFFILFLKIANRVLDLRSYCASDLLKHQF